MALDLDAAKKFRHTNKRELRKAKKPVMPWEDRLYEAEGKEDANETNKNTNEKQSDHDHDEIRKECNKNYNINDNEKENDENVIETKTEKHADKIKKQSKINFNDIKKSSNSNTNIIKSVGKLEQNQIKKPKTYERQELDDFSDLQRGILKYLFDHSDQATRVSHRIRGGEIAEALSRTPASVKSTLSNLAKMGWIERNAWKNGVQGWTRYRLSEKAHDIFERINSNESSD